MKLFGLRPILGIAKRFSFFSILALSCALASGENFRVRKVIPVNFSSIHEKVTVESGINDAIFVTLPPDLTYISGVELTLKVPEDIVTWRDSVAYMLYEKLNPPPSEKKQNYYGERSYINTIPGNFSLTLYAPVSSEFAIKDSPYSVKLPLSQNQAGIFLRFMMVMKGVPESLESAILEITAKPILKNKGELSLSISPSSTEEKNYSVFIDDAPVTDYAKNFLTTGEHHLSVVSDSFRNELRTFRIEQAKTTVLSVALRTIEPLLKILCPRDTQVFLDGEQIKVGAEPLVVTQGEHAVKFILGDYEIVKTVSAQKGRTYSVSLNVDATVSDED